MWVGDADETCGVVYTAPFEFDGRPTFESDSVELHGSNGERITYDTHGDC